MDNFLRYFYQDIGRVFRAFVEILSAAFNFLNYLLNFPMRMEIIRSYESEFTTRDWVMLLIVNILLVIIIVLLCVGLLKLFRKIFRFRVSAKEYDAMAKQVRSLQRDLLRELILAITYNIRQVRTFETALYQTFLTKAKAFHYIFRNLRSRSCRQRDDRGIYQFPQTSYLKIIRTEIISPLGDAVSLVNNDIIHIP